MTRTSGRIRGPVIVAALFCLIGTGVVPAQVESVRLRIDGMTCPL